MIIAWNEAVVLEICTDLEDDEDDDPDYDPDFEVESFDKGEQCDIIIIDEYEIENENFVDFEFPDGSVVCGVDKTYYTVVLE